MRLLFLLLFFPLLSFSQSEIIPLEYDFTRKFESEINKKKGLIHTASKPLLKNNDNINADSLLYPYQQHISKNIVLRKLFFEDLIHVDTTDFYLDVNILLDVNTGKDFLSDSILSNNIRGVMVRGKIAEKLYFQSTLHESQSFFPDYISAYVKQRRVVPGRGRNKVFKNYGYDYSIATGQISYSPNKYFNLQVGHDKNFFGDGYRSMLFSDVSPAYPFAKFTITYKNFQYVSLFNASQEILPYDNSLSLAFQRKHGTFNFLNIILAKSLHLGFFEGIIWETTTENSNNHFDPLFFVPIIYSRLPFIGFNSNNNALIGLNLKFIPHKQIQLYGQFAFDGKYEKQDTIFKKTAFQLGAKYFEPFKLENLYFQAEYNQASPYMYASETSKQNYTFYNQPVAHILGANFKEFLSILTYKFKRLGVSYKFNYITQGADSTGTHYGSDIFDSDNDFTKLEGISDFYTTRGVKTQIVHHAFSISYTINARSNLQVFLSYNNRLYKNELEKKHNSFYYFGLRTPLSNLYSDF